MKFGKHMLGLVLKNVNGLKKMDLLGLIITHPYKHKIISAVDEMDDDAQHIGAVNTITVVSRGIWKGYNTDWHGVFKTLEKNTIEKNNQTLIIPNDWIWHPFTISFGPMYRKSFLEFSCSTNFS